MYILYSDVYIVLDVYIVFRCIYCIQMYICIPRLRNSTWTTLLSFNKVPLSTVLDESLRRDKLYPILTPDHLQAIDRRLKFIIATVEQCIREHSIHTVLIDVWK